MNARNEIMIRNHSLLSSSGRGRWRVRALGLLVLLGGVPALAAMRPNESEPAATGRRLTRSSKLVVADARSVDRHIDGALGEAQLPVPERVDDATFVRRAFLDLAGRIPTLPELDAFARDQGENRRRRLVDRLLESSAFDSRIFHFWSDLLRVKTRLTNNVSGLPYIAHLREAIASNTPYDEMVRTLLTASGPAHQRDNGATGYFLRDSGMTEDAMANTMRVFLGTRMECAQCHNHPYDRWTQRDFFQLAAFAGGLEYRMRRQDRDAMIEEVKQTGQMTMDKTGMRSLNRILQPTTYGLGGSGNGAIRLPEDYQYEDAAPRDWIHARTPFGTAVDLTPQETEVDLSQLSPRERKRERRRLARKRFPEIDSRATFAEWITSDDNPRFAVVIANRLWKLVFGRGLIEPVDDMKDEVTPDDPELMAELTALMIDLDYDIREFLRVLVHTDAYQRVATVEPIVPGSPVAYQAPILRRLRAEQMWDSFVALVSDDPEGAPSQFAQDVEQVYQRYEGLTDLDPVMLAKQAEAQSLRYRDPEAYKAERTRAAAEQRELKKKINDLLKRQRQAEKKKDRRLVAQLGRQLTKLGYDPQERQRRRARARRKSALMRAAELPSPAPAGHFLREFGQSDREEIETSHTEGSVPQALILLNGVVENSVLNNPDARVMRELTEASEVDEKLDVAYRALLGRRPTSSENRNWKAAIEREGEAAVHDLVWVLANSHEFRFQR